ncbi:sulfur transport [Bacteriovorax sp. BAL6_X]|uniref:YeeE/YedE family protein n=1 Tax=Bacteriovorax sp. BAL6_X TaxID=1201290 RepID=UPI0003857737|nr:YeeE/YedE family protein [Bacteriovorax sp. BAL6_X]EPZ50988.1 sulfur transport [Bacteriovorax sp. BAL6_X]
MKKFTSLISGMIFGIGLTISGMVNPKKVIGFLDIFSLQGGWDASLAFVMGGAVVIGIFATKYITKRETPIFDVKFHLPTKMKIDKRLVSGAVLFGVGWGIAGICPGPAIVNLINISAPIVIFVIAMFAGSQISKKLAP